MEWAAILLFGLPIWLALAVWIWKKIFKIRSIFD